MSIICTPWYPISHYQCVHYLYPIISYISLSVYNLQQEIQTLVIPLVSVYSPHQQECRCIGIIFQVGPICLVGRVSYPLEDV